MPIFDDLHQVNPALVIEGLDPEVIQRIDLIKAGLEFIELSDVLLYSIAGNPCLIADVLGTLSMRVQAQDLSDFTHIYSFIGHNLKQGMKIT